MITIVNRYIPPGSFIALTMWPLLLVRRELTDRDMRHESIHGRQQVETMILTAAVLSGTALVMGGISMWWLLLIPGMYYILYVLEWCVRLLVYRDRMEAYRNISAEQEAYLHDWDAAYPGRRTPFCWTAYLARKTWHRNRRTA